MEILRQQLEDDHNHCEFLLQVLWHAEVKRLSSRRAYDLSSSASALASASRAVCEGQERGPAHRQPDRTLAQGGANPRRKWVERWHRGKTRARQTSGHWSSDGWIVRGVIIFPSAQDVRQTCCHILGQVKSLYQRGRQTLFSCIKTSHVLPVRERPVHKVPCGSPKASKTLRHGVKERRSFGVDPGPFSCPKFCS